MTTQTRTQRRPVKRRRKMEFSKAALGSAVLAYFAVIALAAWATMKCVAAADYGSAAVIIGATTGIVGAVTGVAYAFYSYKAKCENLIKIAEGMNQEKISATVELAQGLGGLQ